MYIYVYVFMCVGVYLYIGAYYNCMQYIRTLAHSMASRKDTKPYPLLLPLF